MATPRKPPAASGKEGDYTTTSANARGGNRKYGYWYHNGTDWEKTTKANFENRTQNPEIKLNLTDFSAPTTNYMDSGALRYPNPGKDGSGMTEQSDYVLFQFYEYKPPFQKNSGQYVNKAFIRDYNQAEQYKSAGDAYKSVVMYMPEDVSTGFRGNWGGKAISTTGANMLGAAGAEGLDKLKGAGGTAKTAIENLGIIAGAKAIRSAVQAIGGDNLSNDDVFGAISSAILNPNTELLFNSVDMRNFQLNFRLVPRNKEEGDVCNEIVKTFKACTLPKRTASNVFGFDASKGSLYAGFIGVPNLCRVSFMTGSKEHPVLPRFKMCAVTQVDVNYTPDGVYATYNDEKRQPVAMTLALNFQETKICFAEEVMDGAVR